MIEIRNLTKRYGSIAAVDDISFQVKKGEVVGFLGPNGAGKTTTMKIITGFIGPTDGEVLISGRDVFDHPMETKKIIGYLPETPPLYLDQRVEEYLHFVANLKLTPKANIKALVDKAIEKTNLGEVRKRIIGHLSKGFRQRVGIAQALVSDPEILILDEPTVGLDPRQVAEVRDLINGLRGEHTIVLSSHILPEVQATCERIIIINKGKIVAEDTLEGLSDKMQGSKSLEVKTQKSDEGFIKSLQSLNGVINVNHLSNGNGNTFQITFDGKEDTQVEILSQVVSKNVGLLEAKVNSINLEDIFIKLTDTQASEQNNEEGV